DNPLIVSHIDESKKSNHDINIDDENFNYLRRLGNYNYNDIEIDFFLNIIHVQNHRSLRALKRFKLVHDEQTFRLATIINYLFV
ncbi:unnamed protein product, partial [Rotaria socialis]